MGIPDIFKHQRNKLHIDEIKAGHYQQEYFNECNYIWKNYVPNSGQATCLQGELLREIEKIRYEAQDNGNINWNDDYSYCCDFIRKSLSAQSIFTKEEKEEIILIMSYLKECGEYAQKFNAGKITPNNVVVENLSYIDDNLYDRICDKIGKMQKSNPKPLPYKQNPKIKR